jgi:hypothetical protein
MADVLEQIEGTFHSIHRTSVNSSTYEFRGPSRCDHGASGRLLANEMGAFYP